MFLKYWELGYSVMPIKKNSKDPLAGKGWDKWATERQPIELIESYEEKYPIRMGYGIGIILGRQSNLICIDVDHKNQDIIAMVPPSPVLRLGNPERHGAMFYQYTDEIRNQSLFEEVLVDGVIEQVDKIDLLIDTKYIVLPPSIHPLTETQYSWASPDTLENMANKDLPVLTAAAMVPLFQYYASLKRPVATKATKVGAGNRNNKLKDIVSSIIINKSMLAGEDDVKAYATKEIYEYDKIHHAPPLFSDPSEGSNTIKVVKSEADILTNARRFVESNYKSAKASGRVHEITVVDSDGIDIDLLKFKTKPLPELPGHMLDIKREVLKNSPVPNDTLATCAVVSLFSVLCSTKYILKGLRPNTFCMALAGTGVGKDAPRSFLSRILNSPELKDYNLLGIQHYVSAPATIIDLPLQRTRLDVVDEFSSFIKSAASHSDTMKRAVMAELTQLYSIGVEYYAGIRAVGREETGACYAPSVSILGVIQPSTFIETANKDMLDIGFFPRFMYFYVDDKSELSRDSVLSDTREYPTTLAAIKRMFPTLHTIDRAKGILPESIQPALTAIKLPKALEGDYFDALNYFFKKQRSDDRVESTFYSRGGENMNKIMQQFCVAQGREHAERNDIDQAMEFVDTTIYNSLSVLRQATSGDYRAKMHEKFMAFMAKTGIASSRQVIDLFKGNRQLRESILRDCIESDSIALEQNGKKLSYRFLG